MNNPYLRTSKDARQNRAMRHYITEPLIKEIGLEGFMPIIINADKMLRETNNVGLRELELKLLDDGMVSRISKFSSISNRRIALCKVSSSACQVR